jgi:integrase/recombinase XerD
MIDRSIDQEVAAAFDRNPDLLAQYSPVFETLPLDPFALFVVDVLDKEDPALETRKAYYLLIDRWTRYMSQVGRHPACPSVTHVQGFYNHWTSRGLNPDTVGTKLKRLGRMYQYFQAHPAFPHPPEYDPFSLVIETTDFSREKPKKPHRIPLTELRAVLGGVTHLRDRLIICLQLKLGLRASEVSNLQLQDVHLDDEEGVFSETHPELGAHERVRPHEAALYIASRDERPKNKSRCPRVLPIDAELHSLFRRYLLVRPDAPTDRLLLGLPTHRPISAETVGRVWREAFLPEYGETDVHRAVTSHFGRHYFSTYWRVKQGLNRELLKYMRGDTTPEWLSRPQDALEEYIHTYFEDIEEIYRERNFEIFP